MMSLTGPIVLTPLITYIRPQNYDFELLKEIKQMDDADEGDADAEEFEEEQAIGANPTESAILAREQLHHVDDQLLLRARKWALWASILMTLCFLILWPVPMYATSYVFSVPFFRGWVVVLFLWAFYAAATIMLLPIWEGRKGMWLFFVFLLGGKRKLRQKLEKSGARDGGVIEGVGRQQSGVGEGMDGEKRVASGSVAGGEVKME